MRKPTRKGLVRTLDKVCADYIKAKLSKENPMCRICWSRPIEHCFHWVTRANYATRWDEENLTASCAGCNLYYEHNPHPALEKFIQQNGLAHYEKIVARSKKIAKFSNTDLQQMVADFRKKMEAI